MKDLDKCDGCGTLRRKFQRWVYVYPDVEKAFDAAEERRLAAKNEPIHVLCGPCGDALTRAEDELAKGGASDA